MEVYEEYRVVYYKNAKGKEPVREYILGLQEKERVKIFAYIELLKDRKGYLNEPYAKHITGKIRELRVDFSRSRHRIFYFTAVGKRIILLHAFLKKTSKTPNEEIGKALRNYSDFLISQ